jgi:hypothetical protein
VLIAACVRAGRIERARQLAADLREQRPHISVERSRTRSLPGRDAYLQRHERFYEAFIQAGVPESWVDVHIRTGLAPGSARVTWVSPP